MSFSSGTQYDFLRKVSRETSYAVANTRELLVIGTVALLDDVEKLNVNCQILSRERVVKVHSPLDSLTSVTITSIADPSG